MEAELQELLGEDAERRTEDGRAVVVRNGYLSARKLQTGLGPVTVEISKVRAKTGGSAALLARHLFTTRNSGLLCTTPDTDRPLCSFRNCRVLFAGRSAQSLAGRGGQVSSQYR